MKPKFKAGDLITGINDDSSVFLIVDYQPNYRDNKYSHKPLAIYHVLIQDQLIVCSANYVHMGCKKLKLAESISLNTAGILLS